MIKKLIHKNLRKLLIPVLVTVNIALILIIFHPLNPKIDLAKVTSPAKPTLQSLAGTVLKICQSAKYKPDCYDKEIPKLMSQISMEEAFAVTRLVQAEDSSYSYCHVLGHNLAAEEVKKNPDEWKDVIARCPSGMCSNGCLHGGFQERFRTEAVEADKVQQVIEELKTACEAKSNWKPTGLEQASCYHALGHLAMYLMLADIDKSLKICDQVAVKADGRNFTKVCYDGTFMQIFQPLEPEDFALIKSKQPDIGNVDQLCQKYSGQANASCIGESWPLFFNQLVSEPAATIQFCSKVEPAFKDICYSGIFYVLTTQLKFDEDKIVNYCSKLPVLEQGYCLANAADRFIETDYKNTTKAINLCDRAPQTQSKDYCFNNLVGHASFNFHPGSAELINLCNNLPGAWKTGCLTKI